ncbi:MAG: hypothetical protein ABJ208_29455, partial [Rhodopirellula bahusiensis]
MIALQAGSNAPEYSSDVPVLRFRVDVYAKLQFLRSQTNCRVVCVGRGSELDPWLIDQVSIPSQQVTPTESLQDRHHFEFDADWRHVIQLGSGELTKTCWPTLCPVNECWSTRTAFNTESTSKSFVLVTAHHLVSFEIQNDI